MVTTPRNFAATSLLSLGVAKPSMLARFERVRAYFQLMNGNVLLAEWSIFSAPAILKFHWLRHSPTDT